MNRIKDHFAADDFKKLDAVFCNFLLSWDQYETANYGSGVIDFNVSGFQSDPSKLTEFRSQIEVLREIDSLRKFATSKNWGPLSATVEKFTDKLTAHEYVLRKKHGQQFSLREYLGNTLQLYPAPFEDSYLHGRKDSLAEMLSDLGCDIGKDWYSELDRLEQTIDQSAVGDYFRSAYAELIKFPETVSGVFPRYDLEVAFVRENAYWNYWVSGSGQNFKLTFNTHRNLNYTPSAASQFVFHELVGHCAQMARWRDLIGRQRLPNYFGITTVHSPEQFAFEGFSVTAPLFFEDFISKNPIVKARVLIDHMRHMVFGNLHVKIHAGSTLEECRNYVRDFLPFWSEKDIIDDVRSRSTHPIFSAYQYSYATGFDFFVNLLERRPSKPTLDNFITEFYSDYLRPRDVVSLLETGTPSYIRAGD